MHRQHRPAVQRPEPVVQQLGADRRAATPTSWSRWPRIIGRPRTTSATCGRVLESRVPRRAVLLPPADIVSQILNFGLPAPIDVQIVGRNLDANRQFAAALAAEAGAGARASSTCASTRWRTSRAAAERRPHARGAGRLHAARRREQPARLAERQRPDVAEFWLNPATGVSYAVATQTPQYRMDSLEDLRQHSDHRRRQRHGAAAPREPGRRSRAAPAWRSCRTTTCSR